MLNEQFSQSIQQRHPPSDPLNVSPCYQTVSNLFRSVEPKLLFMEDLAQVSQPTQKKMFTMIEK